MENKCELKFLRNNIYSKLSLCCLTLTNNLNSVICIAALIKFMNKIVNLNLKVTIFNHNQTYIMKLYQIHKITTNLNDVFGRWILLYRLTEGYELGDIMAKYLRP